MTRTPNLISLRNELSALDENDSLIPLSGYDSGWQADGADIGVVGVERKNITHYVIEVAPSSANDVNLYLYDIELIDIFNEHSIQFHVLGKSLTERITISASIFRGDADDEAHLGNSTFTEINVYGVAKSDIFISPEIENRRTDTVSLRVKVSGHNGNRFYITYPCLINIYGWSANNFVQNGRAQYIPHFYWDIDQQQTPEYSLYKLFDALTYSADQALVKYREIFGYSLAELPVSADGLEEWANSKLVDPLHVDPNYLEWLSQFSGRDLQRQLYSSDIDIELFKNWQVAGRNFGIKIGSTESLVATASLALCGRVRSIDLSIGGRIVAADTPIRTGITVSNVARNVWQFDYDGTFDHLVDDNQGSGFNGEINVVKAQSDGKILCGGSFTSVNSITRTRIARLNLDGSLDDGFDASTTFGGDINDIAISSDGNIFVGGSFTSGTGRYLKKINSSGTPVSAFNTNIGTNINGAVRCIAIDANNKILVGGSFTDPASYIGRFNSDGTEDTTFTNNVSTTFNGAVNDIAIQYDHKIVSDHKIVVVGEFTKPTRYVARLNLDGTEDTTFSNTIGNTIQPVKLATTAAISNLSSYTSTVDGVSLTNGDRVLVKNQELTASITGVTPATPSSGKVQFTTSAAHGFSAGDYVEVTGIVPGQYNQLYLIDAVGTTTFDVAQVFAGTVTKATGSASSRGEENGVYTWSSSTNAFTRSSDMDGNAEILAQPIIAVTHGTTNAGTFWKLEPRDLNFTIGQTSVIPATATYLIDGEINTVAIDGDDKIIIGGAFSAPSNRLARLLEDGEFDSRFNSNIESFYFGSSASNEITSVVVNSENDIFVGGEFYPEIKKINSDGTLNTAVSTQLLKTLVDMRSIAVLPYYQNNPWKIHVMTLARETSDTAAAASITAAARNTPSSGQVTYTTSAAHGFVAGDTVTVRGLSPSEYNGTFSIISVTTSSPHRIVVANSAPSGSTTDGTGTASRASAAVLELLEYCRPMGYSVTHSSENLFEFTLNSVALGKLSKSSLG